MFYLHSNHYGIVHLDIKARPIPHLHVIAHGGISKPLIYPLSSAAPYELIRELIREPRHYWSHNAARYKRLPRLDHIQ